jgi:hypothetical protein
MNLFESAGAREATGEPAATVLDRAARRGSACW